jgi:hypothetical protein
LPNFQRIAIELRKEIILFVSWGKGTMSGQIPRPIRSIALASTILVSGLGATVSTNSTRAADCVTTPTSSAPQNNHWYYRTDRANQRKCWHLRAADRAAQPSFKGSTADRQGDKLSERDREKLFAEFLEWKRQHPNN